MIHCYYYYPFEQHTKKFYQKPIIQKLFEENGVKLHFSDEDKKCDALIGFWETWEQRCHFLDLPHKWKFVSEHSDSTHAKSIDEAMVDDRIKSIFKHSLIRDPDNFYKEPVYRYAEHMRYMLKDFPQLQNEDYHKVETRILSKDELEKIKKIAKLGVTTLWQSEVLNDFYMTYPLEHTSDEDIKNTDRKWDVFFVGITSYWGSSGLTFASYHRTAIYNNLLKLKDKYKIKVLAENERISREEFFNTMKNTKVIISPHGIGCLCYRDWEGVIHGNEIVAPDNQKQFISLEKEEYN